MITTFLVAGDGRKTPLKDLDKLKIALIHDAKNSPPICIQKGDWERIRAAAEKEIQEGDLMPGHFYRAKFDFDLDAKGQEIIYKLESIELIETDDDGLPF